MRTRINWLVGLAFYWSFVCPASLQPPLPADLPTDQTRTRFLIQNFLRTISFNREPGSTNAIIIRIDKTLWSRAKAVQTWINTCNIPESPISKYHYSTVPSTASAQWSYLWASADGKDFAVWYKSIVQHWRSQLTGGWKLWCPWVAWAGFGEAGTFKRCNLDKFPRLTKWTKWSLKVKCALFSRPDFLPFMPMENWDAHFEFKHFSKFVANDDLLRAQLLFCH